MHSSTLIKTQEPRLHMVDFTLLDGTRILSPANLQHYLLDLLVAILVVNGLPQCTVAAANGAANELSECYKRMKLRR